MNKFYKTKAFLKNIYVTEEKLMATMENFETPENFNKQFETLEKESSDNQISFSYDAVVQIVPYPETFEILVNFMEGEEEFASLFEFYTYTEYEEVLNFILQKQSKLQKTRIANSSPKYIIRQSLYAIAIIAFTFAMAYSVWDLQQGNIVTVSGRKKGLKQLLVIIGDTLGIGGSVVCGTLILAGFGYYSWKKYQEIKDERDGYRV